MNEDNKNGLLAFVVACVYVLGAVGSIGYTFWCKAWAIGVGAVAVAAMALPFVIDKLRKAGWIDPKKEK